MMTPKQVREACAKVVDAEAELLEESARRSREAAEQLKTDGYAEKELRGSGSAAEGLEGLALVFRRIAADVRKVDIEMTSTLPGTPGPL